MLLSAAEIFASYVLSFGQDAGGLLLGSVAITVPNCTASEPNSVLDRTVGQIANYGGSPVLLADLRKVIVSTGGQQAAGHS